MRWNRASKPHHLLVVHFDQSRASGAISVHPRSSAQEASVKEQLDRYHDKTVNILSQVPKARRPDGKSGNKV